MFLHVSRLVRAQVGTDTLQLQLGISTTKLTRKYGSKRGWTKFRVSNFENGFFSEFFEMPIFSHKATILIFAAKIALKMPVKNYCKKFCVKNSAPQVRKWQIRYAFFSLKKWMAWAQGSDLSLFLRFVLFLRVQIL